MAAIIISLAKVVAILFFAEIVQYHTKENYTRANTAWELIRQLYPIAFYSVIWSGLYAIVTLYKHPIDTPYDLLFSRFEVSFICLFVIGLYAFGKGASLAQRAIK